MNRILLDQGLPPSAATILRERGFDAVHTREISLERALDEEILRYAERESRTVVTLDRDFSSILAITAAQRPSVVLIRKQRLRADSVAELIGSVFAEYEDAIGRGCVVIVNARGVRCRMLPFQ